MNTILNRLKEISSAVLYAATASDTEAVLERIAQAAKEVAETKYAALGIPDGKGSLKYFKTAGISSHAHANIANLPKGFGLIGAIMRERDSIRVEHMSEDDRSVGFPEHHPNMDSFLGVPIIVGDHLYGMLYLSDKINGEPFNDEDQLLVEMVAGYAALAIASADLRQQESRLRLLEERERIGMELHDGIIQSLYGIGMQVSLMRHQAEIQSGDMLPIIDSLNDVIDDIRQFISDLRSRDVNKTTILRSIIQLKERLHPPQNILFTINAPDVKPPFTPATFESVCLIINEAMSNAVRHAQATRISVHAEQTKNRLIIAIVDDGDGFDVDTVSNNGGLGLGLRNMRHRARLYGGDIAIESQPGTGTKLTIQIPTGAY